MSDLSALDRLIHLPEAQYVAYLERVARIRRKRRIALTVLIVVIGAALSLLACGPLVPCGAGSAVVLRVSLGRPCAAASDSSAA